jgi:multiple sugar transport system permease protein
VFLAQNGMLWRAYLNSLIISTTLTIGTLFTSSLAAYAFAKLRFKGKNGIYALFIATLMIPGQVTILPLFMVFAKIGWTDTFLPLIIPGIFINTYGVFMLRQFMVSIPNELLEAAEIDGCGYFRKYLHIILPLCKPALIILGLFTFIGSWNNYFGQLIYLSSPDKMTIALFIASLKDTHANGVQWGMIMAATTLSIIPISIVYLKSQKYFVQGIATTGIK